MRERLPNRRRGEVQEIFHHGKRYVVAAGFYPDGRLGELFIDTDKPSMNELDHVARDAATTCSLALQHGTPIETIRDALSCDANGNPAGVLGAAIDAVVKRGTR